MKMKPNISEIQKLVIICLQVVYSCSLVAFFLIVFVLSSFCFMQLATGVVMPLCSLLYHPFSFVCRVFEKKFNLLLFEFLQEMIRFESI